MTSMNCSPPRAIEPIRLAAFPAANARIRNRLIRNIGSAILVSMIPNDDQQHDAADQAGQHPGVGPAGGVAAVGLDAVGDRGQQSAGAEANVTFPAQSMRARRVVAISRRLR